MDISAYWVPCSNRLRTCINDIDWIRVDARKMDKFAIGCQVCRVSHIWKRQAKVLILDGAALWSSAIVGDLKLPPSFHLHDLGSIGCHGGSHEPIFHTPVHEIPQGIHLRLRH